MLLMIDNYDSFTYNLVQYFGELGQEVVVYRNDEISINEIESLNPNYIVISPGPCTPNEAGISLELIKKFTGKFPILGVCLGFQAIVQSLVEILLAPRRLCMVKFHLFITPLRAFLKALKILLMQLVTTH